MNKYIFCISVVILVMTLGNCDKSTNSPFYETGNISLSDGDGNTSTGLEGGESAYWDFDQLLPTTVYDFTLKNQSDVEVAKATLTTDANGEIPLTAIGYDLGLDFPSGSNGRAISKLLETETFTIEIYNADGKIVSTLQFPVDYGSPVIFAADQDGFAQNSFLRNQHPVWAKGKNLNSGEALDIYVVDDKRFWTFGDPLNDVSGGHEAVTIDGNGEFHTKVWSNPSLVAPYDIVVDFDRDGTYSAGDLVDGYYPVGFMVQVYASDEDLQLQIACNRDYQYIDIFQTTDNVYAYLNPRTQQFTHKWVHKYVVPHQDVWNNGDLLNDVTQVPELDTPQYGCTNEGRVLIWPAELAAGKYDVVIDVDRNGVYDRGLDFLDNIDSYGQPTAGFIVGSGIVAGPTVTITNPVNGSETDDEIAYLEGTVSDTTINFAKLIVNGVSQTIGVTSGVLDYTAIVLQRGWNTIRVEAFNADGGAGFAEVTVNGNFPTYGMKVTLTWNLGPYNDVDLWVQDPTGEWCGFTNKNTGIGGWLDLDDTEGYGPENFRISQDAVDANPGDYNVLVHYWDDAGEGPTIPTLHIVLHEGQTNQIIRTLIGPALSDGEQWNATTITMPNGTFSNYNPTGKLLINSYKHSKK